MNRYDNLYHIDLVRQKQNAFEKETMLYKNISFQNDMHKQFFLILNIFVKYDDVKILHPYPISTFTSISHSGFSLYIPGVLVIYHPVSP